MNLLWCSREDHVSNSFKEGTKGARVRDLSRHQESVTKVNKTVLPNSFVGDEAEARPCYQRRAGDGQDGEKAAHDIRSRA